jgi:hypothetical protein
MTDAARARDISAYGLAWATPLLCSRRVQRSVILKNYERWIEVPAMMRGGSASFFPAIAATVLAPLVADQSLKSHDQ